jgi:hypothetical protein
MPLRVVMDAIVIKVYGEGEWRVRRHGYSKRRTWRKLHVWVDAASGAIFALAITANDFCDGQLLPEFMDQLDANIAQVSGDGAYDMRDCFQRLMRASSGRLFHRGTARVSDSMATLEASVVESRREPTAHPTL